MRAEHRRLRRDVVLRAVDVPVERARAGRAPWPLLAGIERHDCRCSGDRRGLGLTDVVEPLGEGDLGLVVNVQLAEDRGRRAPRAPPCTAAGNVVVGQELFAPDTEDVGADGCLEPPRRQRRSQVPSPVHVDLLAGDVPASSEHKKAHAAAMSSGVPSRPSGARATTWSQLAIEPDSIGRRIIGVSMAPGGMVFTVMPCGARSSASALVERDDPALGGDVMRHTPGARLRRGRRDRDDASPPPPDHVGHRCLDAVKGAGQVDRQHAVPRLGADVEEVLEPFDAGAGDENLERAEGAAHPVECHLDPTAVADVDRCGQCTSVPADDFLGHLLGSVGVTSSTPTLCPSAASCRQMAAPMPEAPPVITATRRTCDVLTPGASPAEHAADPRPATTLTGRVQLPAAAAHRPAPRGSVPVEWPDVSGSAQLRQGSLALTESMLHYL